MLDGVLDFFINKKEDNRMKSLDIIAVFLLLIWKLLKHLTQFNICNDMYIVYMYICIFVCVCVYTECNLEF